MSHRNEHIREHHSDSRDIHRPIIDKDRFRPKEYPFLWKRINASADGLAMFNRDTRRGKIIPGTPAFDMLIPSELVDDQSDIKARFNWPTKGTKENMSLAVETDRSILEFGATMTHAPGTTLPGIVEVFEYNANNLPKNGTWAFFVNLEYQMAQMEHPIVLVDNSIAQALIPYFFARLDYVPIALLSDTYDDLKQYTAKKLNDRFKRFHQATDQLGNRLIDFGPMIQWYGKDPQTMVTPEVWKKLVSLKKLFDSLHTQAERTAYNGKFFEEFRKLFLRQLEIPTTSPRES